MSAFPTTVPELLVIEDVPVVAIDQESMFTYVNGAFEREYGYTSEELMGKPVTEIMPHHMRNAHNVGFSRFVATETSVLLGRSLPLSIVYKDGHEEVADHYILGEKVEGRWRFAAIIDYPKRPAVNRKRGHA